MIIVPVSGGKDSQLVLDLAVKRYGRANVMGVHNFTGTDSPITMQHLQWMQDYYDVPIDFSRSSRYKDLFEFMLKRKMIPGRLKRLCTDEFKVYSFNEWLKQRTDLADLKVLFGMRAPESQNRHARYHDFTPDDEFSLRDLFPTKVPKKLQPVRAGLPIVQMSTGAVFGYFAERKIPINPLYARGHRRVGCYPCLLAGPGEWALVARDPVGRQHISKLHEIKVVVLAAKGDDFKMEHRAMMSQDLPRFLEQHSPANPAFDPLGFFTEDDFEGGCSVCAG